MKKNLKISNYFYLDLNVSKKVVAPKVLDMTPILPLFRIQCNTSWKSGFPLKESRVVTMKSFSTEFIEAIVHKCSKKGVLKTLEELTRKQAHRNTTSGNKM